MQYEEYEDLNKAKKRIMELMQTKYEDADNKYIPESDNNADVTMTTIIKLFESCNNNLNQSTSLITRTAPGRNGVAGAGTPYFKTLSYYHNFVNFIYNLLKNLENINKTFQKIKPYLNFVEPELMNMLETLVIKYDELYTKLLQISYYFTVNNQKTLVSNHVSTTHEVDREYLQNIYDKIDENTITWHGHFETIKETYNYNGNSSKNTMTNDDTNTNSKYDNYDDE
jgi:hypothetical protein